MKLTIDRSKWLRGESGELRRSDGKMCCLGFFGLACGAKPEHIAGHGSPDTTDDDDFRWPEWLVLIEEHRVETQACHGLMTVNDSEELDEPERERCIADIFASHGVEVTFVDGDGAL